MDLIERYVNTIRTFLPRGQQDDIVRELSANLRAEADDREEQLGRPLTEGEVAALLQAHGHPILAAGRYQGAQGGLVFGRQLISPALFPLYLRALAILIGIGTLVHVAVLVALAISGQPVSGDTTVNSFAVQVLVQFVVVTVGFIAADRVLPTTPWTAMAPTRASAAPQSGRVSLVESSAQIIIVAAVAIWLQMVYAYPESLFGPAAATYRLGAVWGLAIWPIALVFAITFAQAAINLARPQWMRLRLWARMISDVIGLGAMVYLLEAGQWVALANPPQGAGTLGVINQWVFYSLLFTGLGFLFAVVVDLRALVRHERKRARTAG